jgi:hypothetical protein
VTTADTLPAWTPAARTTAPNLAQGPKPAPEQHPAEPSDEDRTPIGDSLDRGGPPAAEASGMPAWVPRLLLWIVVTAFLAYAAFSLVRRLQQLLLWLIAALFLSFALEPAVNWLVGRGWRRGVAAAVVLFGLGLLGLVALALMVPLVIDQVQELVIKLPSWLDRASVYTQRWFDVELTSGKILRNIASAQADIQQIATNVASFGAFVLGLVFQVLTIGLFTVLLRGRRPALPARRLFAAPAADPGRPAGRRGRSRSTRPGATCTRRLLLAVINARSRSSSCRRSASRSRSRWPCGWGSCPVHPGGGHLHRRRGSVARGPCSRTPGPALIFLIFVVIYHRSRTTCSRRASRPRRCSCTRGRVRGRLAGAALSGLIGAFMALPAAAVIQSTVSNYLKRHEVVDTELTRGTRSMLTEAKEERRTRRIEALVLGGSPTRRATRT